MAAYISCSSCYQNCHAVKILFFIGTKYFVSIFVIHIMKTLQELQYPVGQHTYPETASEAEKKEAIDVLIHFPSWVEHIISNKDEAQLETPYRQGGWNSKQVIHHCADSHLNCLLRLKLALTENNPTIKPYDEALWAECSDYHLPINNSTTLLHCIHRKIVSIFSSLSDEQWQRTYYHPQYEKSFSMQGLLLLYAWHCKHHFGHLKLVLG
jgi:hypothetical protein